MKKAVLLLSLMLAAAAGGLLLSQGPLGSGTLSAGLPYGAFSRSASPDYSLASLLFYRKTAEKITSEYVDPARVRPKAMLRSALQRVSRLVPQVLFDLDEDAHNLRVVVASAEREVPVPPLEAVRDLTPVLSDVAAFLDENLPEDIERQPIEYALMNGVLRPLDPHSIYMDPESYGEMQIQNEEHFGGLGITIGIRERRLTILYPLADTPAWKAGLEAGDRIDMIGNESTVNMQLHEAVSRLRGKQGTQVTITITRAENGEEKEVTLTRDRIQVPSVRWAYAGDGVGYLWLKHFSAETDKLVKDAIIDMTDKAIEERHGELKGLVIDLRDNPGGYLNKAMEVADEFLRSGTLVITEGIGGRERDEHNARRFGSEADLPLVILVNEGSASASEIVAGAFKYNDRGVVMGVRTFGKGSVQNLYDRDFNEGALKLTIAQYKTAGDRSIQGLGVLPDIELREAYVDTEDGEQDVRLFWQDFAMREEDLESSFQWGNRGEEEPSLRFVYSCKDCFEGADRSKEEEAEDRLDTPQVQAAKALLLGAPFNNRVEMLKAAPPILRRFFAEREQLLETEFEGLGIDWSAAQDAPKVSKPQLGVELSVDSEDGKLMPGSRAKVAISVTNRGDQPINRLRAVTDGDFFGGREYFFGRLAPGETATYEVQAWPRLWLHSRTEEVTWRFFADNAEIADPFRGRLQIQEIPHPRFAIGYQVIDDGSGKSKGNGDGLIQPGEAIDLLMTVKNIGDGPTSDIWKAEHGLLSENEDKDGDGVADKKGGIMLLKSEMGSKLGDVMFLKDGVDFFSLRPGEESRHRMHFVLNEDVGDVEGLEVIVMATDESFFERVAPELRLPIFGPSDPIKSLDRPGRPKHGPVTVYGGASKLTAAVATLSGPFRIKGSLGPWLKVELPWDASGWVQSSEVASGNRNDEITPATELLSYSPPVVQLAESPGGTVVVTDTLQLSGSVLDDKQLKDLYVFVTNKPDGEHKQEKKVHYQRLDAAAPQDFQLNLKLAEGENDVEIYARDDQELVGAMTFSVYREAATVEAVPSSGESTAIVR